MGRWRWGSKLGSCRLCGGGERPSFFPAASASTLRSGAALVFALSFLVKGLLCLPRLALWPGLSASPFVHGWLVGLIRLCCGFLWL